MHVLRNNQGVQRFEPYFMRVSGALAEWNVHKGNEFSGCFCRKLSVAGGNFWRDFSEIC